MPTCRKCSKHFPNVVTIDGKKRILCSRKYCLSCSPFGKHNTSKLHIKSPSKCTCSECGRRYRYKRNGCTKTTCNSCVQRARKHLMKKKAIELLGASCWNCGYSKCIGALVFHHFDPSKKELVVGKSYNISWDKLREEVLKCALLCSNCHAEVHDGLVAVKPRKKLDFRFKRVTI